MTNCTGNSGKCQKAIERGNKCDYCDPAKRILRIPCGGKCGDSRCGTHENSKTIIHSFSEAKEFLAYHGKKL